ncbi:MAG: aminoglycoside phosphotransferase family protein [Alphaproteobacteria bacterium]|nr:aminoglycoside phosphotransferase family protein [Alphaproteobacteria bacterium]
MAVSRKIIKEVTQKVKDFISLHPNESIGVHSCHFFYITSDGKEYVVLIPKDKKAIQDYKKQETLLPFLHKLHLPVLIPNGIDVVENADLTFAVEEKINGCEWNYETYTNFSETEKKIFSKQIAVFLFKLHQTSINNLPDCSFDDFFVFPDKETFFKNLRDVFPDEIKKDLHFVDKIYERAKVIFDFGKEDVVFMHRDFHPQNTFIDKEKNLCAVIDWASCCVAPRIREFQNLAGTEDKQLLINVLQNYNMLANTNILPEQVVLFNQIEWITCLDILKENPSLLNWAKKDGALLAMGKLDKQIEKFLNV